MGGSISFVSPDIAVDTLTTLPQYSTSYAYDPSNPAFFGIKGTVSQTATSEGQVLVPVLTAIVDLAGAPGPTIITCSDIAPVPTTSFEVDIRCDIPATSILQGPQVLAFRQSLPGGGIFGYDTSFGFSIAGLTTLFTDATATTTVTTTTTSPETTSTSTVFTSTATATETSTTTKFPSCASGPGSVGSPPTSAPSGSAGHASAGAISVPASKANSVSAATITPAPHASGHAHQVSHGGHGPSIADDYEHHNGHVTSVSVAHNHGYDANHKSISSTLHSTANNPSHDSKPHKHGHCKAQKARRQAVIYAAPDFTFGPGEPAFYTETTSTTTVTETTTSTAFEGTSVSVVDGITTTTVTETVTTTNSGVGRCASASFHA